MKKTGIFTLFSFCFLLLVCNTGKSKQDSDYVINDYDISNKVQPIDIIAPKFFWLVQPWKEGRLATIDGWGCFAEISFVGKSKISIKSFSNFPRLKLDRKLITWPEAGIITSTTGKMQHIEAVDEKKTMSHVPMLSWVHKERRPILLDSREGLIAYPYYSNRNDKDTDVSFFVFNYKENKMVYKRDEQGFSILPIFVMDEQYVLSWDNIYNGEKVDEKEVFYNWRTNEIIENDLTKAIYKYGIRLSFGPYRNINLNKRYLIGYSSILEKKVKVSWDEKYSDIKIILLNYLFPKENGMDDLILSSDGKWGSAIIWGYIGLYNENLCKRAFFHLDDRYPNGISIPVITEDYEKYQWDYGAFVKHPVHGMCYAQEWHKEGILYLRLYKMDDVLAEINRQLAEKENK